MAAKKKTSNKSPLVGTVTKPITLDQTTKLDIDTNKKIVDNIIEASIGGSLNTAELEQFTAISNSRDQIYQLIDTMMKDSVVSSIVRTYAEDACEVADNGHIIWCESNDPKISKFVNYLLNIMNVDKNIFSWVYSLIKYGDVYLRLYRESDYKDPLFKKDSIDNSFSAKTQLNEAFNQTFEEPTSKETASLNEALYLNVHSASDPYSYYIEMVPDPGSMFELTKFGKTYGYIETPNVDQNMSYLSNYLGVSTASGVYNYRMKTNDVNIYQADDFVHAYLADDTERFPEKVDIFLTEEDYKNGKNPQAYQVKRGKSLLYDSYKIWREKSLLENAVLLNRITRSSVVRTIQVEVGDMSKTQVQRTLTRIKSLMEQKSSIDAGSSYSEYTNPGPVENNIYLATHNGQGAVTIGTMGGDVDIKNIADLDYWTNKFYSSYGIPKQYFGWCLSKDTEILLLDGSTHTIEELYNNKSKYIGKGILGCNQNGSLCPTKITDIMLTNPAAKCLRIWLDNGKYVDVTPDHLMMLRDGSFVPAGELKEGESLMPYYDRIKDGRRYVLDNALGKFVPQYQIVAAAKGEPAEAGYNIHHINRIKIDDDFDNLVKLSIEDHCKEHNRDLAAEHKLANEKRRLNGEAVNGNVGGRYITNGEFYTTIKADEELPDGFWFEGPKKPDSMKKAISDLMKGKKKNYDNTSHLNTPEIQAKSLAARQKTYDLQTGRKEYLVRCPNCGKIHTVKITPEDYTKYLASNKFYYCSAGCRAKFDYNGKLERSLALYSQESNNLDNYEAARQKLGTDGSLYFTKQNLENRLYSLVDYVPEVNHKIVKIDVLEEPVAVYDLSVAADCHTFALPCGIFVHNCDDAAGFNGGTSLSILSSIYGKGVIRIQNAIIQAITDAVNLILINKGCKAYLNNFVLKMKAPATQEEKDYRESLSNRVNTISNIQSLFSEVEDKSNKLNILKTLVSTLNYGDELTSILDKEIAIADKQKQEAEEAKAKEAEEAAKATATEENASDEASDMDLDLGMADVATNEEVESPGKENETLLESQDLIDTDDLPLPEDLAPNKDFTKNE